MKKYDALQVQSLVADNTSVAPEDQTHGESSRGSPFCSRKVRLVADYAAAVAAYNCALGELEQAMITASKEIYLRHRRGADEARSVCEAARKILDDHVAAHDC
jgi:hypothetical protein